MEAFFEFSFLDCSLLMYKNATLSGVLTLYLLTSLNSFFSSKNFFVELLGFSTYKNTSTVNRDKFTSFFLI